ncbi:MULTISPECIES: extracellular solute-binding protein [unclassified Crossiella]|uniref:extracellular solute-binding protein n=1 Tax=unclassified Crossiella TaxID=2620835 RepID=UPI001FFF8BF1|nr:MULTISPECIES: extracellular solute-binding protein [unclassified Crossiella]MCK2243094.1 extracellular solute-binding protein [Crossiella sp. S99.2]MCK2256971.1 extracellular solute-binding protein [Crossiella sp. S99.1]
MIRSRWLAATLTALTLLAACVPGSNLPDTRPTDRQAKDIKTDVAAMGEVTLTVWDQEVRGGQDKQITALNEEFQRKYPNIRINRVPRSFDDLRNTTRLGLTSVQAPDVVQVNNGRQDMGAYVKAGLLLPMDGYAEVYRWHQRFPATVLRLARYPASGDPLGEGKLFGLPQGGELVGIFFNKQKLARLGIAPPRTWAEFDAALRKAKEVREVPIQFGNLEKSAGIHLFGFALNRFAPTEDVYKLATGRQGVFWADENPKAAAELLVRWADQGMLTNGFSGLGSDAAWREFAQDKGVFLVSGTWLMADLEAAMGDKVGFVLPPTDDGKVAVTAGTSVPFAISARSRNPDAAAAYIEFLTSSRGMALMAEHANLPVVEATSQRPPTVFRAEVFNSWAHASETGGLVPYLDYATPTAYDTVTSVIEQLLAKRLSPQQALDKLQADVDAARGGR